MASLFSKPKPAAMAKPEAPKPLPRVDDAAVRNERLKEYAALQRSSGRESTRLEPTAEDRLGDYAAPLTRGSAILGG